jgi:DNA-binding CsgD family transcriptional regulator
MSRRRVSLHRKVGEVVFHQDFPSGEQDDLLVKVYEHLLDSGDWDAERLSELTGAPPEDVKRAQGILVDLRAIEHDPRNGSWRAVSPQLAMAELALPIEVEVRQRARQADKLREQLRMLLPAYESKLRSDPLDAIQVITEGDVLAKLINHEISCCSVEFAVMLSRADPGETDDWYQRTHGQGARIRAVYQHSARTPEPGADYTEVHNLPRGELRTIAELPVDMLLFDQTTIVLLGKNTAADEPGDQSGTKGEVAVVVRHPVAVSMMAGVFEEAWSRSTPVRPLLPQPEWLADDNLRAIVRLLATGAKDDSVARRLGMSIRKCRRHVAELMRLLGTSSRFQAGVEAARRGLV